MYLITNFINKQNNTLDTRKDHLIICLKKQSQTEKKKTNSLPIC